MRKSLPYAFALAVAVLFMLPARAAEAHPGKPGRWQIKMEMEIPGMPVKMPPITHEICLTEEDMQNPDKAVPGNDPKKKTDCKVNDYKVDGNTVSWTIECPKQETKGVGQVTYDGDSYSGWLKMTVRDQEMKTKYSGKWLGTCEK